MPTLQPTFSETRELALSFALMLFDRFTGTNRLVGDVVIRLGGKPFVPFQRVPDATFLFFDLAPGAYVAEIRGEPDKDFYYLPADIPIVLPTPNPLWPGFPDVNLADQNKPLDDPTQPAAYRAQRAAATLQPGTAYPFPAGATLIRGTVLTGGAPLAGAHVQPAGTALEYVTGTDGQFVLFLQASGSGGTVTLHTTHAQHAAVDQPVPVRRGMTVATTIVMA